MQQTKQSNGTGLALLGDKEGEGGGEGGGGQAPTAAAAPVTRATCCTRVPGHTQFREGGDRPRPVPSRTAGQYGRQADGWDGAPWDVTFTPSELRSLRVFAVQERGLYSLGGSMQV